MLSDKLVAERGRSAHLERALQHSQACLEGQKHRTQRAMRLLLDARSRHDRTIEVLDATYAQASAAAAAESAAKRAGAAAAAERQQHAVHTERLRVQLASVSARAAELQSVVAASDARLQVRCSVLARMRKVCRIRDKTSRGRKQPQRFRRAGVRERS